MSAIVSESYKVHTSAINANGDYTGVDVEYVVFNADDEDDALTAVKEVAPSSYGNLPLDTITIGEKANGAVYKVIANYKTATSKDNDSLVESTDATMTFDCGGGTKHVCNSYLQTVVYPSGSTWSCNPNGFVEWNGKVGEDSEVKGVDVPTAQLRETYTKVVKLSSITNEFKRKMANLVGKINNATFKGWNAGEVMFLGCSYDAPVNAPNSTKVKLTFNFAIQQNELNSTFAGVTINKYGWTYVWALQVPKKTSGSTGPAVQVQAVVLDRVCQWGNFSDLGL